MKMFLFVVSILAVVISPKCFGHADRCTTRSGDVDGYQVRHATHVGFYHGHNLYLDGEKKQWGSWSREGYKQAWEALKAGKEDDVDDWNCTEGSLLSHPPGYGYGTTQTTLPYIDDNSIRDCEAPLADDETVYNIELRRGYNFISIPLDNPQANCMALENVSDLVSVLGTNVNYAYSVGLDAFRTQDGEDKEITPTSGFVLVMNNAVDIEIRGTPLTEVDLEIQKGYVVYGIPVQAPVLAVVDDFFDIEGIWAVYYYQHDGGQILAQERDNNQEPVRGGTAYMIHSSKETLVTLTGEGWDALVPNAPPAMRMSPHSLTTTWGEVKR